MLLAFCDADLPVAVFPPQKDDYLAKSRRVHFRKRAQVMETTVYHLTFVIFSFCERR